MAAPGSFRSMVVSKRWCGIAAYRPGTGAGGRSDVLALEAAGRRAFAARFSPRALSTEFRYDAIVQADDELLT